MHSVRFLCLIGGVMLFLGPAAGTISLDAHPLTPFIGERVYISGHSDIPNTIAVYLFVTGPGLNRAGATLENLQLKAGSGYFTSAFVHPDGTFEFEWNTAFIVGHLVPGTYRIYAVNVPLNLDRITDMDEIAMDYKEVTFQKPPSKDVGIGWGVPMAALLIAVSFLYAGQREERQGNASPSLAGESHFITIEK